jgi:hypothetical protein
MNVFEKEGLHFSKYSRKKRLWALGVVICCTIASSLRREITKVDRNRKRTEVAREEPLHQLMRGEGEINRKSDNQLPSDNLGILEQKRKLKHPWMLGRD